ncbi:hypothetical protein [Burkholderia ubonensis]|uniref:hypothetical protein n=1 Tax=Burkholderia ubonensis TaxID=101571 RepID=UPI000B2D6FEB|nr:hypothetical protein [Burkholderia ubonensis]
MLDLDYVITIHDEIIRDLGGLAHSGRGGVKATLHRVENHALWATKADGCTGNTLGIVGLRTQFGNEST